MRSTCACPALLERIGKRKTMTDIDPKATLVRRFRIEGEVGKGGMGIVLKATDLEAQTTVAVKYCHLNEPEALRRFAREVRVMATIKHQHVVPILFDGSNHNPPFFVMPYAPTTLRSKLPELSADENKAIAAFLELCSGALAVHNAGAIHRDINPNNALIIDDHVVLSDLGLAKLSERDTSVLTQTITIVGTQLYLAPEQRLPAGSRDADVRTDIYQLGKNLYQLLTGLDPLLTDLGKVSPGLAHIIRKATQEHPDHRYQSIGQLIDAITSYQKAKDPSANPHGAFDALMSRVKEQLKQNQYQEEEVKQLLNILLLETIRGDASQFLDLFDRIPTAILSVLPEAFADLAAMVLREYVSALDATVGQRAFEYAETVARKMETVFDSASSSPEIKTLAIEATLVAAVQLNRFAAMDSFDSMLMKTLADPDAYSAAEMLSRRADEYKRLADRVPENKL